MNNKEKAEQALTELGLDILTQEGMDDWYNETIQYQPVPQIELPDWEEFTGYLSKEFYIKINKPDCYCGLRVAYYYPDGTIDKPDIPVLDIENE